MTAREKAEEIEKEYKEMVEEGTRKPLQYLADDIEKAILEAYEQQQAEVEKLKKEISRLKEEVRVAEENYTLALEDVRVMREIAIDNHPCLFVLCEKNVDFDRSKKHDKDHDILQEDFVDAEFKRRREGK